VTPAEAVPEICQKLRPTQPRPAPRHDPPTALLTWPDVWGPEVSQGVVNPPRIDGKDGVAGSIPAGGSTTNQQLRPGPASALLYGQRAGTARLPEICQSDSYAVSRPGRLSRPRQASGQQRVGCGISGSGSRDRLRASKWQPTAVRTGVFPGGAGPSGAKLGVLRDGHLHRSQHRLPGIVCQDQSGTATVKPRQQLETGPVASNEVSLAHVDAVSHKGLSMYVQWISPASRRSQRSPGHGLARRYVAAGRSSRRRRRWEAGRRSVTRCRAPRACPPWSHPWAILRW
jgi:hypothetical protein